MKKLLLSLTFLSLFLVLASPASAVELYGTFTASNIQYDPLTNHLTFTGSNFSEPVTQVREVGITNCNTIGCSGEDSEFYGSFSVIPITDPYNFDAILSINSYRPSSGTVYVEFSDAGNTYQRMWSQPLNYDDIIVSSSPTPTPPSTPTIKEQCKKDGWKNFTNPTFKNQGACVSFVEKHK